MYRREFNRLALGSLLVPVIPSIGEAKEINQLSFIDEYTQFLKNFNVTHSKQYGFGIGGIKLFGSFYEYCILKYHTNNDRHVEVVWLGKPYLNISEGNLHFYYCHEECEIDLFEYTSKKPSYDLKTSLSDLQFFRQNREFLPLTRRLV